MFIANKQPVTRLDYCQYLVSSQINYTLTNFADHSQDYSHDQLNRYLRDDKLKPPLVWEQVKDAIVWSASGYLLFDDPVADKNYSHSMDLVRRQYSGNAHAVIKGSGIVTCVYVNPETNQFWLINDRLFAPSVDGKSKLDHVREMFDQCHRTQKAVVSHRSDGFVVCGKRVDAAHRAERQDLLLSAQRQSPGGGRLWRNGKTTVSARGFFGVDGNGT